MAKKQVRLSAREAKFLGKKVKPKSSKTHGSPFYLLDDVEQLLIADYRSEWKKTKKRVYLSDDEAFYLGKKINKSFDGKKNARYVLNKLELVKLDKYRSHRDYKMKTVKKTFGKDGELISEVKKIQQKKLVEIPEYHVLKRLSTNTTTGQQWVISEFDKSLKSKRDQDLYEKLKSILKSKISDTYEPLYSIPSTGYPEGVLKLSDLHFGAMISGLVLTPDFNSSILESDLHKSVESFNKINLSKRHVHIHGDLIESFTGLNHINSWMSLNPEEIGANAIILCANMLHRVLKNIENLGCIKIVAGNHDRGTSRNDQDVMGWGAKLIANNLSLMGYDVEFHPYVVTHKIEGINHIILHGDKGVSKNTTESIVLDYGIDGMFNYIAEGHLHTLIEKLSIKQRSAFKTIKDDHPKYRRMVLQSFFPGNYYSETMGFVTSPGYAIIYTEDKEIKTLIINTNKNEQKK